MENRNKKKEIRLLKNIVMTIILQIVKNMVGYTSGMR